MIPSKDSAVAPTNQQVPNPALLYGHHRRLHPLIYPASSTFLVKLACYASCTEEYCAVRSICWQVRMDWILILEFCLHIELKRKNVHKFSSISILYVTFSPNCEHSSYSPEVSEKQGIVGIRSFNSRELCVESAILHKETCTNLYCSSMIK